MIVDGTSESLSVLVTVPWAERLGGAEEMLCTFLEHADPNRLAAHVVLFAEGPLADFLENRGIRTTVIPAGRLRQAHLAVKALYQLTRLIAAEDPDVIFSWTTKSHVYTAVAAILARRHDRLMWWQHGIAKRDPLDRLAGALPAVAIGCSSEAVAAAQREVSPARRTIVVYPGVPSNPAPSSSTSIRQRLKIPRGRRVLGIVGRVHPMKGQDLFVQALALLRDEGRDIHGLIVGGDAYDLAPEYSANLGRQIRDLGLEDRVTLTGHVPRAEPYIEALDVLVCASTSEPFGIVLLEAMRAGVPVISTRVGGPAEIIRDGESGLLLHERSAGVMADALRRLLDDPEHATLMSAAGLRLVEENFTAEAMATRIHAALTEVARSARKGEARLRNRPIADNHCADAGQLRRAPHDPPRP